MALLQVALDKKRLLNALNVNVKPYDDIHVFITWLITGKDQHETCLT